MLTRWGAAVDPTDPWSEHPRPQLVRPTWASLNGRWECAFAATGDRPTRSPLAPLQWQPITVPFPPESVLSGVRRQLQPGETLHYRRTFDLPPTVPTDLGRRVLLHFGAVDQDAVVRVNDVEVGRHRGGYLPFTFDVTDSVRPTGNRLEVTVADPSEYGTGMRGKQRLDRGGIWYTATSGIWQSVWLESVPRHHVTDLRFTTRIDDRGTHVEVLVDATAGSSRATVQIGTPDTIVAQGEVTPGQPGHVTIPDARLWSPDDPFLYDVHVRLGAGETADRVSSYVGLRTVDTAPDEAGITRFRLNGEPIFLAGVLDQGFWPDGISTPPSDQAIRDELATVKRLGFNLIRKHVRVEPLRWYHHCDRLGLLVWQDAPNGGGRYTGLAINGRHRVPERARLLFGRTDRQARKDFRADLTAMVDHLDGLTSVAGWVVFNEGWGQYDARPLAEHVERLDPHRVVVATSGWHDRGGGHVDARHEYLREWRLPRRRGKDTRALSLSEYGGYGARVEGHTWGTEAFEYRHFDTLDDLARAFERLHTEQILPTIPGGLAAAIYTQLTDVEDELNGLFTYDRAVAKIPEDVVRRVTDALRGALPTAES